METETKTEEAPNQTEEYFKKVKSIYDLDPRSNKVSFLVAGRSGTKKTYSLLTAPKPIFVDSFDPGGTASLRYGIQKGFVIPDTRWEVEDDANTPKTLFERWSSEMKKRASAGVFDNVGTYVIDSATRFGEAVLNHIMVKSGAGIDNKPEWEHYRAFGRLMDFWAKYTNNLPCHNIWIFHQDVTFDEVDKTEKVVLSVPGKSKNRLYELFDINLVAEVLPEMKADAEPKYRFRTSVTQRHLARTRGCKLPNYVEQDYGKIIQKALENV